MKGLYGKLLISLSVASLILSGCSSGMSTNANPAPSRKQQVTSNGHVDVVAASNMNVSGTYALEPESFVRHAISWRLSNGATVDALHADIPYAMVLGNIGAFVLRVPGTTDPYYYFVYVSKKNSWSVGGIVAAPVFTPKLLSGLPEPYTKLIGSKMPIKNVGTFYAFYNKDTFLMLGNSNLGEGVSLPKGQTVHLSSGQNAVVFNTGGGTQLYYVMGQKLVWTGGNIPEPELIKLLNTKDLNFYQS